MAGEVRIRGDAELAPVAHRARWIAWGLALQVVGVGVPLAVVLRRAEREDALGQISRSTVRLAWHAAERDRADVALGLLGVALFAAGSVLLARPFARRRSTLLVAVPLAAVVGVLVLGAAALVLAGLVALAAAAGDGELPALDLDWIPWPSARRRDDDEDRDA